MGGQTPINEFSSSVDIAAVPEISVVVPIYNEAEALPKFFARVIPVLESLTRDFEIVCVNDGSADATLQLLHAAHSRDSRVKVIDLSRHFGKEPALTAGLDFTTGRAVIPIDADLQDPPQVIAELVALWKEGFDVVLAIRSDRRSDGLIKRLTARMFYSIAGRLPDVAIPANAGDFRLMDRRVVQALKQLPERARFMKGLFAWLGFRQTQVTYVRAERAAGRTKFRPWSLWHLALEGLISFTTLPLKIWTYIGAAVSMAGLGYGAFLVVRTLMFGIDFPGYASLAAFVLFFGGINLLSVGVLGEYVARIFIEVKQRPLYLVREAVGFQSESRRHEAPTGARQDSSSTDISRTPRGAGR